MSIDCGGPVHGASFAGLSHMSLPLHVPIRWEQGEPEASQDPIKSGTSRLSNRLAHKADKTLLYISLFVTYQKVSHILAKYNIWTLLGHYYKIFGHFFQPKFQINVAVVIPSQSKWAEITQHNRKESFFLFSVSHSSPLILAFVV